MALRCSASASDAVRAQADAAPPRHCVFECAAVAAPRRSLSRRPLLRRLRDCRLPVALGPASSPLWWRLAVPLPWLPPFPPRRRRAGAASASTSAFSLSFGECTLRRCVAAHRGGGDRVRVDAPAPLARAPPSLAQRFFSELDFLGGRARASLLSPTWSLGCSTRLLDEKDDSTKRGIVPHVHRRRRIASTLSATTAPTASTATIAPETFRAATRTARRARPRR